MSRPCGSSECLTQMALLFFGVIHGSVVWWAYDRRPISWPIAACKQFPPASNMELHTLFTIKDCTEFLTACSSCIRLALRVATCLLHLAQEVPACFVLPSSAHCSTEFLSAPHKSYLSRVSRLSGPFTRTHAHPDATELHTRSHARTHIHGMCACPRQACVVTAELFMEA